MMYGYATWTIRTLNFGRLRTTHHKLRLRVTVHYWCEDVQRLKILQVSRRADRADAR